MNAISGILCFECSLFLQQVWAFPDDSRLADYIVNEPSWLLQTVIGTVFTSWNNGRDRVVFRDGRASIDKVKKVLDKDKMMPGHGDLILKMLLQIGIFIESGEDGTEVVAPSKMKESDSLLGKILHVYSYFVFCGSKMFE